MAARSPRGRAADVQALAPTRSCVWTGSRPCSWTRCPLLRVDRLPLLLVRPLPAHSRETHPLCVRSPSPSGVRNALASGAPGRYARCLTAALGPARPPGAPPAAAGRLNRLAGTRVI